MAPEQADPRRPAIGPAADVYALGVVLYELLSGRLPFDPERLRRDPVELVRILREEEPRSLSSLWTRPLPDAGEIARRRATDPRSLRRLLRGELSWIVHRCLEKDPRRRYPSARALADDIERHLTHRPVEARRPGLGYRAGKLVRRHRTATSAVAAALATLALAAAGLPLLGRSGERAPTLLEQITTSGLVRGAGISPSGRYVLYHERSRGNESVLWLVDRDTGALERLPDMPGPAVNSEHRFSRDERFLYVKSHGKGEAPPLHRLDLAAGKWEDLWSDPPDGATVSPDETRLAGVRNDAGAARSRLVVADLRGRTERTIASRALDSPYEFVSWSPDGRAIGVTVGTDAVVGGPVGVVEVDVETGREREIGPPGWNLGLSADGRTLAISAVRFRAGLWVLQPGGGTTQVARNAYDGSPAPDGRTLVVTLIRGGIPNVYRIDPDARCRCAAARRSSSPATRPSTPPSRRTGVPKSRSPALPPSR